jgi:hypothetical protein
MTEVIQRSIHVEIYGVSDLREKPVRPRIYALHAHGYGRGGRRASTVRRGRDQLVGAVQAEQHDEWAEGRRLHPP